MSSSFRTLFLTCQTPYPPIGGAALRNWQNINILKDLGEIYIFSIPLSFNTVEQVQKRVIPGIEHWEEHAVTCDTANQGLKAWLSLIFPNLYREEGYFRATIANRLEEVVEQFCPDLVIVSEIGMSSYLDVIKGYPCQIIFDNHNVESQLFKDKSSASVGLKDKVRNHLKYLKVRALEEKSIQLAQQVWLCSETDYHLTIKTYGDFPHIRVVPNGVNIQYYSDVKFDIVASSTSSIADDRTVIFIGSFGYYPNRMAAKWLLEDIFPALQRKHPESHLILAGSSPTPEMCSYAELTPNVTVTGRVEDLRPYLASASVVLIPLRHGSGTRLKILEAFAAGRAVVSTSKGAEGLSVAHDQHLLIADNSDDLVNGVCKLWGDEDHRHHLIENAYELVKSTYSWDSISIRIRSYLKELS